VEDLDQTQLAEIENWANYLKFQWTWAFKHFVSCEHDLIALFTGNQAMKTASCAYQYVLRILGRHPVPKKNVLYFECDQGHMFSPATLPRDWICPECNGELKMHERGSRVFRFASEVLPGEKGSVGDAGLSAEVKNSVYPEFKKWLPPHFLRADITYRNMAMRIADPNSGKIFCGKEYKGDDILVELVAYSQSVQSTAGKQRLSVWEDEEPPFDFHEEQLPRLMSEDGDLLLSLTAANRISWTYDELFERAQVYIRTKAMCDILRTKDYEPKQIEYTDSPYSIAVIQAASDDNPTLTLEAIEKKMSAYDDPDVIMTRRYGIHKQIKGRIFKSFDYKIHVIDEDEYLPYGILHNWVHARGIDYHPQTPWACGIISLSPEDEAFIWYDYNPSPEKLVTKDICLNFATMGKDYKFILNLVDPLAAGIKKDKITVLDDINREFYTLKKEGIGTGGYWQTWDTKGEKGRDEIKKRLMNSVKVGRPFNNRTTEHGKTIFLPTIWIVDSCKTAAKHMRMWRWEEFVAEKDRIQRGEKNKPQEKWSHFNMVFEAIFKHPAFKPRREKAVGRPRPHTRRFQGRR